LLFHQLRYVFWPEGCPRIDKKWGLLLLENQETPFGILEYS